MLESVSLDQLRVLIAAADSGSFSAAGRMLHRTQSRISQTIANLESELGVELFDRTAKYPRLTDFGEALLVEAKTVVARMDGFKARARTMAEGLEPELSVVIDVVYPMAALTKAIGRFKRTYPHTPIRLYVEALGGVAQAVIEGRCRVGVIATLPTIPEGMHSEALFEVPFATVVAPQHPLSKIRGIVPKSELSEHVQLVLSDRTPLSAGLSFGVVSPLIWRLADMGAKLAFLRAGFGWGHMPLPMIAEHLARKELVRIRIDDPTTRSGLMTHAIYRKNTAPGPAGKAFIQLLRAARL
jgi:DNA-binding transcriptional LysR family regulator